MKALMERSSSVEIEELLIQASLLAVSLCCVLEQNTVSPA